VISLVSECIEVWEYHASETRTVEFARKAFYHSISRQVRIFNSIKYNLPGLN